MKKNIPFVKEIQFNTNIYEITSISLEHNIKTIDENEITGEFIISGDYKENDNTIKAEPYIFNIPFDIELDFKYNSDKTKVEIEDFNYELIGNDTLKLNIVLALNGVVEEKGKKKVQIKEKKPVIEKIDEEIEIIKDDTRDISEKDVKVDIPKEELPSIFNNYNNIEEKYVTYYVHIYRDKDDINEIIKKYNISKEELEEYNNLDNITLGSKLIIPNNEQV